MINSVKARTPILTLILFVFAVGYTVAATNKVVVIPIAGDSTDPAIIQDLTDRIAALESTQPLAYALIAVGGTALSSYGIAGVTNTEAGLFVVTLDKAVSGYPVVVATSLASTPVTEVITHLVNYDSNTITLRIVNELDNPINTDFSIVVHGTAQ